MMKVNLRIFAILMLIVCTLSGCAELPDNTTLGTTANGPVQGNWDMTSFFLDSSGNVSDGPELTVAFIIDKLENDPYNRTTINYVIEMQEDFRYWFKHEEGEGNICTDSLAAKPGDYIFQEFVYDTVSNSPASAICAINTEKEYFIARFSEDGGQYLVASTDPSLKPDDILNHFTSVLDFVAHINN